MGRNDCTRILAVLFVIGCLAMTTECRLVAGGGQTNANVDAIAVVNSTSTFGESKRNAILCGPKACIGNGGELYKCYCCVRPGLTCFPSEDDCEFKCKGA
ncbi:unnamed protein product [Alopecurus aequalis]